MTLIATRSSFVTSRIKVSAKSAPLLGPAKTPPKSVSPAPWRNCTPFSPARERPSLPEPSSRQLLAAQSSRRRPAWPPSSRPLHFLARSSPPLPPLPPPLLQPSSLCQPLP